MIHTEKEYTVITGRIEELLQISDNIENQDAKGYIELNILSDLVVDYEELNFPIIKPSLTEVIKLRMAELGLNQKRLSEILGVSTSRVSEYLTGKSEPTLKVARKISEKLGIEASIVLGV
ncbi:helix-turn-helix domain-containing protein [Tenacibaculum finnmarkense]|uniref:helix-turn-helix domain-containing protein n=1 Tax=Tenacibaculum finnmarkense TaxID=2781243 RepID=UPI001E49EA25|nr:helix-turn-helix transcriptional regulator [Tenacibaculum finnmarkense]MCD8408852.1 helix-turn-helix domain-containing protein [Tenacibaculum finnmarkense genomovar ulcerans]MCD8411238.1 helix-turn-helix domain-containing protein [Tenacibaculum finnmarkense genomovar ulcerans]MCG8892298.1 helix-turn-helix transcriptional regulator [Tenacibaculum finnmarkense]MCG8900294.1 helix-turn-helix transcriptional regulator [Tenacibaculum finnmarkense]